MLAAAAFFMRWRKLIAVLLAVAAVVGALYWVYSAIDQRGYARAEKIYRDREKAFDLAAERRRAESVAKALEEGKRLQAEADKAEAQRAVWEKSHEAAVNKHVGAVLTGVERLRVEVRASDPIRGAGEDAVADAAGAAGPAQTADILPEVAAAILSIAGDSARDMYDYNDLLDRYRMIEKACR